MMRMSVPTLRDKTSFQTQCQLRDLPKQKFYSGWWPDMALGFLPLIGGPGNNFVASLPFLK